MHYSIKLADNNDYIAMKVYGPMNRQIVMEMFMESCTLGKEHGIKKFFMNLTDAINDDSTTDQYHLANTDLATADFVDRTAKVAALVAPNDHSHDFIETVIRNVGFNLRLFRKREDAMEFLGCENEAKSQQV